jgi:hypothetical protein
MPSRYRLVLLALVAGSALVVSASAGATQGDPKRAITKADQAKARSIVIRLGDLGTGFASRPNGPDTLPPGVRCGPLSEADLTVTGDAESPDFTLDQTGVLLTIGSTASAYRTLRDANASWARGMKPAAVTCLADIVRKAGGPGQKVSLVSARRIPFPRLLEKTTAFRVVVRVGSGQSTVKVFFDAILLQQGRFQAGLVFTSAVQPVGSADQQTLAGVVASRVQRAARGTSGPTA